MKWLILSLWHTEGETDIQLQKDEWYPVVCRVDGSVFSVTCQGQTLEFPFKPQFPVFIWLEVQRTGAKYRNIIVEKN